MANFRVGQRVKIVKRNGLIGVIKPGTSRVPLNSAGTIIGAGLSVYRHPDKTWDWRVKYDCDPTIRGAFSFQLEPIVDDGRQVITWDACVWRPQIEQGQPA